MKKQPLKTFISIILALMLILLPISVWAHSGRTDSRGGHKDNKNKSGLGSYHYHCGGHPAHLHKNGVCPYSSKEPESSSSSKSSTSSTSKKANSYSVSSAEANKNSPEIDSVIRTYIQNGAISPVDHEKAVHVLLAYATKTVNIRKSPDASSEKIGYICDGEKILVVQAYYTPKWHQVIYQDQIGYASANLCKLTDTVTRSVQIH